MGAITNFLDSKIVKKDTGETTYLTWKETLGYSLGRGAQGMSTSIMSSDKVNYFLSNILKIDTGIAATIRLLCGLWDAINDPLFGLIMDKTRTKYGKMRPYVKYAPFISAIFTLMFFMAHFGQSHWSGAFLIGFVVFAYVGWDMAYTAVDVPMGALALSMTPNPIERTKLFGVQTITRAILSAAAGGILPIAMLFPYFQDNTAPAYTAAAVVAFVGMILLTRPAFHWTQERAHYSADIPSVKDSLKLLFQNKPLFMLLISNVIFLFATLPAAVRMYFTVDVMGSGQFNFPMELAAIPSPFIAGLLVPYLAERLGKRMDFKKMYMGCCVVAGAVHLLLFVTMRNPVLGATGPVSWGVAILIYLQIACTLIPLECKNMLSREMEAQTVDYIERKTGQRAEGIMLSLVSFTGKLQNSASSSVVLALLAISGYVTHQDAKPVAQTPTAKFAIFAMYTLIPAAAWFLMLIPLKFFNTEDRKQKAEDRAQ
ncbi:MAG: MFS transporter [Oscillospiraceae bacterium]|jgi:Na+/melibiose symporter-like transporter|nr:MFS transporter [Oscillospiraceae bacterium]